MPRIRLDNREIEAAPGATVLEAAHAAGIEIPALCYLEGYRPNTSCFVCVVKVDGQDRLVPACATRVAEGMVVESETEEVRAARRAALELLLGDHLGDCLAPCQTVCPAHLDIPALLRAIAAGRDTEAAGLAYRDLVLPGTLGRVCPAPCEKGCRRGPHDGALHIRLNHRWIAETVAPEAVPLPECAAATGKRVAIVGAGPAGLGAAWQLRLLGHAAVVYEMAPQPGGALLRALPAAQLPPEAVQADVAVLLRLGVELRCGTRIGPGAVPLEDLRRDHDAVLLATGELTAEVAAGMGVPWTPTGLEAEAQTHLTPLRGVFVAGSAQRPLKMAVRAVAEGRAAARAIDHYLAGREIAPESRPWTVHMGRLSPEELAEMARGASPDARLSPWQGEGRGLTASEPRREAERCLHCDCRALADCRLRRWAAEYGAQASRFAGERRAFVADHSHARLVYEPGKCLDCGLCVQLAEELEERLGVSFLGRGFPVRMGVPFGENMAAGLPQAAEACARVCPTGALAVREEGEYVPPAPPPPPPRLELPPLPDFAEEESA